jgi:hypothetical protein
MFQRLMNNYEELTFDTLSETCTEWDAHVYPKVRLADIFPIANSGITDLEFRFCLQSHFDFVVTDSDFQPLFAVEFDGKTHQTLEQRHRDNRKGVLCERFKLPVLRINSRYLDDRYRDMNLLCYLIEIWFLSPAFNAEQAKGNIPPDELFDPAFILRLPGRKHVFPLWLSVDIQSQIRKLSDAGRCQDPGPSHVVAVDAQGTWRAIAYIFIASDKGIYTETAMRAQAFPIVASDFLADIAIRDLYERLLAVLGGKLPSTSAAEFVKKLEYYRSTYGMCSSARVVRAAGRGPKET